MGEGMRLQILGFDEDVVEVRVRAGNGRFAAAADCYAHRDVFSQLAAAIRGFPASWSDRREFVVGTFDPGCAGGGVRLVLRCTDRAGHALAEVHLRTAARDHEVLAETASFCIPVEPAAVDAFVVALDAVPMSVGADVVMPQAI